MAGPALFLSIQPPDGAPYDCCLNDGSVVVGRSSRAGLAIPDLRLSREHARLSQGADGWSVEDLGSHNGTYLNGERVLAQLALKAGDVLSLGGSRVTVKSHTEVRTDAGHSDSGRTLFRPVSELLVGAQAPVGRGEGEALRRHAERLRLINEVHQALSSPISQAELLELILDRAFAHLRPEEGAVYLRGAAGEWVCAASRSVEGPGRTPIYSSSLVREVAEKGLAALVLDVAADQRFAESASILGAGLQSLVAAPLYDPQGSLGMIVLASKVSVRCFVEDDMELLASLASAAALRIRNVALAEEAAERRRLEHEMSLARRIQEGLLPTRLPEVSGWEVYGSNRASRHVSGDLYTAVLREPPADLAFMVADVAGKGVAASLLAASLEALCAGPVEAGMPPHDVFARVSSRLYRRTPPEKYATAFLAALETASGRLTYANAGHLPALVLGSDGAVRWLPATGMPLGLMDGSCYTPADAHLGPAELLVLYTDGFTEAENAAGEEYGQERLAQACVRYRDLTLPEVASALEVELGAFTGNAPLSDDRTLLLLRRLPA